MHWIYAHLIGDYLLQTDWMAKGKKRSTVICAVHVFFYMLPFLACDMTALQLGLIAVQHFLQDRTNFVLWFFSRAGKNEFLQPPAAPWSVILLDNILHILWMAFVAWAFHVTPFRNAL